MSTPVLPSTVVVDAVRAGLAARAAEIERDRQLMRRRINPLIRDLGYLPAGEPLYVQLGLGEAVAGDGPIRADEVTAWHARRRLSRRSLLHGLMGSV